MQTHGLSLLVLVLLSMSTIPAFAEVSSLSSDRTAYSIDMTIFFSGTVQPGDSQKLVNLLILDPSGKIVLMTGKPANSDGTFVISVNTNDPSQFHVKGTYSATAFINEMSQGKAVYFDFSPDGSPVIHSQNDGQSQGSANNVTSPVQTESHSNYVSNLYENATLSDGTSGMKTMPSDRTAGVGNEISSSDIAYPMMAIAGGLLVVIILYLRRKRANAPVIHLPEADSLLQDLDPALMILKNRLAKGEITVEEFNATKAVLNEP